MENRELKRKRQREWKARRRAAWLADKSCVECGCTDNLEVDHIDSSTKSYDISNIWSMSDSNPNKIAELAKCQVLCHEHHRDKSLREGDLVNKRYRCVTQ